MEIYLFRSYIARRRKIVRKIRECSEMNIEKEIHSANPWMRQTIRLALVPIQQKNMILFNSSQQGDLSSSNMKIHISGRPGTDGQYRFDVRYEMEEGEDVVYEGLSVQDMNIHDLYPLDMYEKTVGVSVNSCRKKVELTIGRLGIEVEDEYYGKYFLARWKNSLVEVYTDVRGYIEAFLEDLLLQDIADLENEGQRESTMCLFPIETLIENLFYFTYESINSLKKYRDKLGKMHSGPKRDSMIQSMVHDSFIEMVHVDELLLRPLLRVFDGCGHKYFCRYEKWIEYLKMGLEKIKGFDGSEVLSEFDPENQENQNMKIWITDCILELRKKSVASVMIRNVLSNFASINKKSDLKNYSDEKTKKVATDLERGIWWRDYSIYSQLREKLIGVLVKKKGMEAFLFNTKTKDQIRLGKEYIYQCFFIGRNIIFLTNTGWKVKNQQEGIIKPIVSHKNSNNLYDGKFIQYEKHLFIAHSSNYNRAGKLMRIDLEDMIKREVEQPIEFPLIKRIEGSVHQAVNKHVWWVHFDSDRSWTLYAYKHPTQTVDDNPFIIRLVDMKNSPFAEVDEKVLPSHHQSNISISSITSMFVHKNISKLFISLKIYKSESGTQAYAERTEMTAIAIIKYRNDMQTTPSVSSFHLGPSYTSSAYSSVWVETRKTIYNITIYSDYNYIVSQVDIQTNRVSLISIDCSSLFPSNTFTFWSNAYSPVFFTENDDRIYFRVFNFSDSSLEMRTGGGRQLYTYMIY